jgi:hypothetical protein
MDKNLLNTIKVCRPEEFKDYHNCIYTRLDLNAPPEVDEDKFNWWKEKSNQYLMELTNNRKTNGYLSNQLLRKEKFPYNMYPIVIRAESLDSDPYVCNFDKLFPDYIDYVYSFPGVKLRSLGFLEQNPQMAVWDHTDADEWLGFRFYHKNTCTTNKLHFKKVKPEYLTGERYTSYAKDTDNTYYVRDFTNVVSSEKIYPKNNLGSYSWALTSTLATHGIDANDEQEKRLTGIVEFWPTDAPGVAAGLKIKETIDLLERSISKYSDEVIWY